MVPITIELWMFEGDSEKQPEYLPSSHITKKGENEEYTKRDIGEDEEAEFQKSRIKILELIDSFIIYISKIRRTFLAISGTSLIQAPVAIALSFYLLFHPSYLPILNRPDDFGEVLTVLFAIVIGSSAFWFATGLKNYRELKRWAIDFDRYKKQKQLEREAIIHKFGLE